MNPAGQCLRHEESVSFRIQCHLAQRSDTVGEGEVPCGQESSNGGGEDHSESNIVRR